jgi:hypothetical protein
MNCPNCVIRSGSVTWTSFICDFGQVADTGYVSFTVDVDPAQGLPTPTTAAAYLAHITCAISNDFGPLSGTDTTTEYVVNGYGFGPACGYGGCSNIDIEALYGYRSDEFHHTASIAVDSPNSLRFRFTRTNSLGGARAYNVARNGLGSPSQTIRMFPQLTSGTTGAISALPGTRLVVNGISLGTNNNANNCPSGGQVGCSPATCIYGTCVSVAVSMTGTTAATDAANIQVNSGTQFEFKLTKYAAVSGVTFDVTASYDGIFSGTASKITLGPFAPAVISPSPVEFATVASFPSALFVYGAGFEPSISSITLSDGACTPGPVYRDDANNRQWFYCNVTTVPTIIGDLTVTSLTVNGQSLTNPGTRLIRVGTAIADTFATSMVSRDIGTEIPVHGLGFGAPCAYGACGSATVDILAPVNGTCPSATHVQIVNDTFLYCKLATAFDAIGTVVIRFTRGVAVSNDGIVASVIPLIYGYPTTAVNITSNYIGNFTLNGFGIGWAGLAASKIRFSFANGMNCHLVLPADQIPPNTLLCGMGGLPNQVGPIKVRVLAYGYYTGPEVIIGSVVAAPTVTPTPSALIGWGATQSVVINGANFPASPSISWNPLPDSVSISASTTTSITVSVTGPVSSETALSAQVIGADGYGGNLHGSVSRCLKAHECYLNEYNATLECAEGGIIANVTYADYGRPDGNCQTGFTVTNCTTPNDLAINFVQAACVNKTRCLIPVQNKVLSPLDPCQGFQKWLAVQWTCYYPCANGACAPGSVVRQLVPAVTPQALRPGYRLSSQSTSLNFNVANLFALGTCNYEGFNTAGSVIWGPISCAAFSQTGNSTSTRFVGTITMPAGVASIVVQITDSQSSSVSPYTRVADITEQPTLTSSNQPVSGKLPFVIIYGTGFNATSNDDFEVYLGPNDVRCNVVSFTLTSLNCSMEVLEQLGTVDNAPVNATVNLFGVTITNSQIGLLKLISWQVIPDTYVKNFSKPGVNQTLEFRGYGFPTNASDFAVKLRVVNSAGTAYNLQYLDLLANTTYVYCLVGPFTSFGSIQTSVVGFSLDSAWTTIGIVRPAPRATGSLFSKVSASANILTILGSGFPSVPRPRVNIFAAETAALVAVFPPPLPIAWDQAFSSFEIISINFTADSSVGLLSAKKRAGADYQWQSGTDTLLTLTLNQWPDALTVLNRTLYTIGAEIDTSVGPTTYKTFASLGQIVPAATVTPASRSISVVASSILIEGTNFDPRDTLNYVSLFDANQTLVATCQDSRASTSTSVTCLLSGANLPTGDIFAQVTSFGGPSNMARIGSVVSRAIIDVPNPIPTIAANIPEITITGSYFASPVDASAEALYLSNSNSTETPCAPLETVSSSRVICHHDPNKPFQIGPLSITLEVFGGRSNDTVIANVVPAPTVTPSTDKILAGATSLTITGTGFDSTAASNNIVYLTLLQTVPTCEITSAEAAKIVCKTSGLTTSGTVSVIVTSFGGNSTQVSIGNIEGGLSSGIVGAAVGGGVGGFIFLCALIALIVFLVLRSRKQAAVKRAERFRKAASTKSLEMQVTSNANDEDGTNYTTFKQFDMSMVQIGKELGQGAFGKVYEGTLNDTVVAIKEAKLPDAHARGEFFQEAQLMLGMPPHENVVRVFGISFDEKTGLCFIVMEMCYGSLDKIVFNANSHNQMEEEDFMRFSKGIAAGMAHLAKQNIVHRDLAARNILLGKDGTPKISDFGMSRQMKETNQGQTASTVGPIQWMAPEQMNLVYSEKSDVWMFACTLFEMLAGVEPHVDRAHDKLNLALAIRDTGLHPEIPSNAPDVIAEVMKACYRMNPDERPSFKKILQVLKKKKPVSDL